MMTDRIPTNDNIMALLGYTVCVCVYKVVGRMQYVYCINLFFLVKS